LWEAGENEGNQQGVEDGEKKNEYNRIVCKKLTEKWWTTQDSNVDIR
jgi:hypothetical protein